jgi:hypothetical protein
MKTKLDEALKLVNEMTADIEGRYPIGLLRVRRLLEDAIVQWDEMIGEWDMEDRVELAGDLPPSAA